MNSDDGFNIQARVRIKASDREGLEQLCKYVLRTPWAELMWGTMGLPTEPPVSDPPRLPPQSVFEFAQDRTLAQAQVRQPEGRTGVSVRNSRTSS